MANSKQNADNKIKNFSFHPKQKNKINLNQNNIEENISNTLNKSPLSKQNLNKKEYPSNPVIDYNKKINNITNVNKNEDVLSEETNKNNKIQEYPQESIHKIGEEEENQASSTELLEMLMFDKNQIETEIRKVKIN